MPKNKMFVLAVAFSCAVAFAGMKNASAEESEKIQLAATKALSKEDQTALDLGRKVLALEHAIQNPNAPEAMKAVTDLGSLTRYYVMVRGWLGYQLQGDMSILDANKERTAPAIRERIVFLQKAIRAVDLEK